MWKLNIKHTNKQTNRLEMKGNKVYTGLITYTFSYTALLAFLNFMLILLQKLNEGCFRLLTFESPNIPCTVTFCKDKMMLSSNSVDRNKIIIVSLNGNSALMINCI